MGWDVVRPSMSKASNISDTVNFSSCKCRPTYKVFNSYTKARSQSQHTTADVDQKSINSNTTARIWYYSQPLCIYPTEIFLYFLYTCIINLYIKIYLLWWEITLQFTTIVANRIRRYRYACRFWYKELLITSKVVQNLEKIKNISIDINSYNPIIRIKSS